MISRLLFLPIFPLLPSTIPPTGISVSTPLSRSGGNCIKWPSWTSTVLQRVLPSVGLSQTSFGAAPPCFHCSALPSTTPPIDECPSALLPCRDRVSLRPQLGTHFKMIMHGSTRWTLPFVTQHSTRSLNDGWPNHAEASWVSSSVETQDDGE